MPNLILCLKCGSRWDPAMMQRKKTFTCAMCLEPMPEAMELDKATWEEGDNDAEGIALAKLKKAAEGEG